MNLRNLFKNYMLASHPIGSVYITTDADFNPSKTWGGVWEKLTDRFLVGAGNNYNLGDVGGEASVKLIFKNYQFGHWSPITVDSQQTNSTIASAGTSGSYGMHGAYSANLESINTAHNNLPPYQSVNMWHRIA